MTVGILRRRLVHDGLRLRLPLCRRTPAGSQPGSPCRILAGPSGAKAGRGLNVPFDRRGRPPAEQLDDARDQPGRPCHPRQMAAEQLYQGAVVVNRRCNGPGRAGSVREQRAISVPHAGCLQTLDVPHRRMIRAERRHRGTAGAPELASRHLGLAAGGYLVQGQPKSDRAAGCVEVLGPRRRELNFAEHKPRRQELKASAA